MFSQPTTRKGNPLLAHTEFHDRSEGARLDGGRNPEAAEVEVCQVSALVVRNVFKGARRQAAVVPVKGLKWATENKRVSETWVWLPFRV